MAERALEVLVQSQARLWALKHCTIAMTWRPLFVRVRVRPADAEYRAKSTSTIDGVVISFGHFEIAVTFTNF